MLARNEIQDINCLTTAGWFTASFHSSLKKNIFSLFFKLNSTKISITESVQTILGSSFCGPPSRLSEGLTWEHVSQVTVSGTLLFITHPTYVVRSKNRVYA